MPIKECSFRMLVKQATSSYAHEYIPLLMNIPHLVLPLHYVQEIRRFGLISSENLPTSIPVDWYMLTPLNYSYHT